MSILAFLTVKEFLNNIGCGLQDEYFLVLVVTSLEKAVAEGKGFILNPILGVGTAFSQRRQDKKRRIENSMKNDESEAAKISKVNTDYPELTTIELETLAELLHYLPTTSDNI